MAHKNEENEIMIPMSVETAKKNAWQLPKVIFNGFDSTGKRVSENTSIEIRGYDDSYVFEDVAKKIGMEIEEQDGQITNIKNLPPFHIIEFSSKISPVPLIQKSENIIIGNVDDIIAEANIEMAMS